MSAHDHVSAHDRESAHDRDDDGAAGHDRGCDHVLEMAFSEQPCRLESRNRRFRTYSFILDSTLNSWFYHSNIVKKVDNEEFLGSF